PDAGGSEDVALLAVAVVQQRDARVAVRVVLDRGDLRRHAVLGALEVDVAVLLLVTTAAIARCRPSVDIAARRPLLRLRERLLRLLLGDLGEVGDRLEPAAGTGGLALADRHRQLPKISIESPSASETIARRWSARLPQSPVRRFLLRFPLRLTVLTLVTFTLKIVSTACLISILLASGATRNVYTLLSKAAYDFSDTTGRIMMSRGLRALIASPFERGTRRAWPG